MSITSSRTIQVQFSGDVTQQVIISALDNIKSPGESDIVTLFIGGNTISPPTVSGIVVTSLTIIPPAANTSLMTLKGDFADVGIPLHLTDPTSLSLDTTFSSLIINAVTQINGVRLIWG